jgi:uncharacterized protein Yka (UPF0111/DUF47 family)
MSKPSKPVDGSPLSAAAIALDAELKRYFELATTAQKVPLNSEKNLDKAARAMTEAAESQDRVADRVRALVEAITTAREAQQGTAQSLAARAQEMAGRAADLGELLKRFATLGEEAKELNHMMQKAAAYKKDPYATAGDQDARSQIAAVAARMEEVAGHAQALAETALSKDMTDIARQADAIRQQVHSARNKLTLLQKSVS